MTVRFLAAGAVAMALAPSTSMVAQTTKPADGAASAAPAAAEPTAAPAADASEGKLACDGQRVAGRKAASGERFNPKLEVVRRAHAHRGKHANKA